MSHQSFCERAFLVGAVLLMMSSNAWAEVIPLGGGWQADVVDPAGVSIVVDLVHPDFLAIQISKDFTDPPGVGGVFPPQLIDFQQIDDDADTVPRIVIVDESISNLTGVDWTAYHWAILNGTDAWLDVPLSQDFAVDPFTHKEFSDPWEIFVDPNKATDLLADEGIVYDNQSFFPGAAPGDGELVIDVDLSVIDPVSFTFKQFAIPEPGTLCLLALGVGGWAGTRRRRLGGAAA